MNKPTYYLWRSDFPTEEAYNCTKETYTSLGFRVVTFSGGSCEKDIRQGIRALIQHHMHDAFPHTSPGKDVNP